MLADTEIQRVKTATATTIVTNTDNSNSIWIKRIDFFNEADVSQIVNVAIIRDGVTYKKWKILIDADEGKAIGNGTGTALHYGDSLVMWLETANTTGVNYFVTWIYQE